MFILPFIDCPQVVLPYLQDSVTCHVHDGCTSLTCCADMDLIIGHQPVSFNINLDICNYKLILGVDKWSQVYDLFHVAMGADNTAVIISDVFELM